jgi:hypothetical protein
LRHAGKSTRTRDGQVVALKSNYPRRSAERYLSEYFIHTPGYTVGEPRPFER